jgi:hypothetical protein
VRVLDAAGLRDTCRRVWSLFAEFPFASPASRGVFWAALLTTACRAALPTAPAILINAQAPGTGKTKLGECLMLASGAPTDSVALPTDAAEQAKTLSALLLAGPRAILFDNLSGVIKPTAAFCSASTSEVYRARGLGGLDMVGAPNRALWVMTGNNVGLHGDVVRRVLTVTLDSPENPETRRHGFDPVALLQRGAADFRADLLALLTSFAAAGMPAASPLGLASFEAWNALVRQCVLWLTPHMPEPVADPLDSLRAAQYEDPETAQLRAMLDVWVRRFGSREVRLSELGGELPPELAADWQEAFDGICEYRGRVDAGRFRWWLRGIRGRKLDGMWFDNRTDRRGVALWRVES